MSRKPVLSVNWDYRLFDNAWTGLAAMILAQAAYDAKALNGMEAATVGISTVSRWELVNFFRSRWAEELASALDLDMEDIRRFSQEVLAA